MIIMDWSAISLGLAIGTVASALFFAGLGWGMRMALRTNSPTSVLVLSAAVRIAALLIVGWAVVAVSGPFALAGFAFAFLLVRTLSVIGARVQRVERGAP
ncbi:MAG: ATP synthase subunit I [Sulfitobacter sp.]